MLRYQILVAAVASFVAYRLAVRLLESVLPHWQAAVLAAAMLAVAVIVLGNALYRAGKIRSSTSAFMLWICLICVTAPALFDVVGIVGGALTLPAAFQNLLTLSALGGVGYFMWIAIRRTYR